MVSSVKSGETWLSSNHDITDDNYWISEVIVSSDHTKRGNKKDFTVVVVDSTREDETDDGWKVFRTKSHGNKSIAQKRYKKKKKNQQQKVESSNDENKVVGM